ncbi:helix-turn-helix transcriptional regulator [Nocardia sp. alder85J]|uniref:helix-turn-helix transcriptional regulator n=1 Tax=Nocardia sp. alder85J TaxID=2862949 RepID=UPI00225481DB|nr:helix-turn-helix transcriptional regulator [Nocardia sp. alder85J]MCX4097510.1 helix-turn-helix transcriptional regulator [Nocardia sp. alder85J]
MSILDNAFSEFLRARRGRLVPEKYGFPPRGRRVSGLRRQEFAELAGLSVEYYTKLEQGRAVHPSAAVVAAIAEALDLDHTERDYLARLLRPDPELDEPPLTLPSEVGQLLSSLGRVIPAFVITPATDVIAWNAVGGTVFHIDPEFAPVNVTERLFRNPLGRKLYGNWEQVAHDQVAWLRYDAVRHPGDRRLHRLVECMIEEDAHFRKFWRLHEVRPRSHGRRVINHADVGVLDMFYTAFPLPADPRLTIVTWSPLQGTETANNLAALAARCENNAITVMLPDSGEVAEGVPTDPIRAISPSLDPALPNSIPDRLRR